MRWRNTACLQCVRKEFCAYLTTVDHLMSEKKEFFLVNWGDKTSLCHICALFRKMCAQFHLFVIFPKPDIVSSSYSVQVQSINAIDYSNRKTKKLKMKEIGRQCSMVRAKSLKVYLINIFSGQSIRLESNHLFVCVCRESFTAGSCRFFFKVWFQWCCPFAQRQIYVPFACFARHVDKIKRMAEEKKKDRKCNSHKCAFLSLNPILRMAFFVTCKNRNRLTHKAFSEHIVCVCHRLMCCVVGLLSASKNEFDNK